MSTSGNPPPTTADDDYSSTALEDFYNGTPPQIIPDFGIWHLSVREAAQLTVADMWFSGHDDFGVVDCPTFGGNPSHPEFIHALAAPIEQYEKRLAASIEAGHLKADRFGRDFDGILVPQRTFIHFHDLQKWLQERDYESGDVIHEYQSFEWEIAAAMVDEAGYLRALSRSGPDQISKLAEKRANARSGNPANSDAEGMLAALKAVTAENERLKEQLAAATLNVPAKVDRKLTTRTRRTLLTIIAALCKHAGLDPQARGTSQRIRQSTETLGTPVDDGTILGALNEIPDALETRMK